MLKHPHYRLREFIGAIDHYHPDVILNEVRPNHAGAAEGSIDGGIEQSIVYAYAEPKGIPVIPVDWFDENFIKQMKSEDAKLSDKAKAKLKPLEDHYNKLFKTGTFEELQSASTQTLVRKLYAAYEEAGLLSSRERNERICENIVHALQDQHSKRVLIVFGLDHKYFQEDCIKRTGNQSLDVSEAFDLKKIEQFKVSRDLRERSIKNITASEALLKSRLAGGTYQGELKSKLIGKVSDYAKWLAAVSEL
jgi:hypothetical protein